MPEKPAVADGVSVQSEAPLTHLDESGRAHIVSIMEKRDSARIAVAVARVQMSRQALEAVLRGAGRKGDALQVARIAGIMAAKQTPALIPLCHPVRLASVELDAKRVDGQWAIELTATASAIDRTGVEMEAMTAVSVAALTLYDMIKGTDRFAEITHVRLVHKSGGKSGTWNRSQRA